MTYVVAGGCVFRYSGAKENGAMRLEGKEYIVQEVRWSVCFFVLFLPDPELHPECRLQFMTQLMTCSRLCFFLLLLCDQPHDCNTMM